MGRNGVQRVISLLEKGFANERKQRVAGGALGRALRSGALDDLEALFEAMRQFEPPTDPARRAYVQALEDVLAGAVRLGVDEDARERLLRAVDKPLDQRLIHVLQESPSTPTELVSSTGKEAAQVSRALARLRELELVESWASQADKRSRIYRLTPLGRDVASRLDPPELPSIAESTAASVVDFFHELRVTGHVYFDAFEEKAAARLSRGAARSLVGFLSSAASRVGFVDVGGGMARRHLVEHLSVELDRALDAGEAPEFLRELRDSMHRVAAAQLVIRADLTRDRWVDLLGSMAAEDLPLKVVPSVDGKLGPVQTPESYVVLYESPLLKERDETDANLKELASRAAKTWVYDDGALRSVS